MLFQVVSPVTKRSLGNHVAAINPNAEIPVADTGRLFCKFQTDIKKSLSPNTHFKAMYQSKAFFSLRFDQTTVEMHFAEVKMGIVSLG